MLNETILQILQRDLIKLKTEISLYKQESSIWKKVDGINNTAGNLVLHLVGNLNTYIGATLGNTGYIRQRELEFSLQDIPRTDLLEKIDATHNMIAEVLPKLRPEQLSQEFPLQVFSEKTSTAFFLVHLTAHLNYHLGQINYHRRLLDQ